MASGAASSQRRASIAITYRRVVSARRVSCLRAHGALIRRIAARWRAGGADDRPARRRGGLGGEAGIIGEYGSESVA